MDAEEELASSTWASALLVSALGCLAIHAPRLTYTNVISTLCLFLLFGTG